MAKRKTGFPAIAGARDAADPAAAEADEREILASVRDAVDSGRVQLAFQPIVAAGAPHRPIFYEGLIRVLEPCGRVIPACDFIALVEPTALGRRIDVLALRRGFAALRERAHLRLSINMSALTIDDPAWMEELDRGLAADPTAGERLIIEVTESSPLTARDQVAAFMAQLHARGIAFAVDDFGTGFTSMRHLREFRFDILKIDGALCGDVATNPDSLALVTAIVGIARHFEMMIVAERVERTADADMLTRIGVDGLQGYLFSAPTLWPNWRDCVHDRSA